MAADEKLHGVADKMSGFASRATEKTQGFRDGLGKATDVINDFNSASKEGDAFGLDSEKMADGIKSGVNKVKDWNDARKAAKKAKKSQKESSKTSGDTEKAVEVTERGVGNDKKLTETNDKLDDAGAYNFSREIRSSSGQEHIGVTDVNCLKEGRIQYGTSDISQYQFNPIENPGPLVDSSVDRDNNSPAKNFYGCRYNIEVLKEDTILYRVGNSTNPLGRWFTKSPPKSILQVRIDTAVKEQWIDPKTGVCTGNSVLNTLYSIKFPAGTVIYSGAVGPQGGAQCGGHNIEQVFMEAPWKNNPQIVSSERIN